MKVRFVSVYNKVTGSVTSCIMAVLLLLDALVRTYGAGPVALYGIIGALIYAHLQFSRVRAQLRSGGVHHVYVGHLHSYLKLGAFGDSDMAYSCEPTVRKKEKVKIRIRRCACIRPIVCHSVF